MAEDRTFTLEYKNRVLETGLHHDDCIHAYVKYQNEGYDPEHFWFVSPVGLVYSVDVKMDILATRLRRRS